MADVEVAIATLSSRIEAVLRLSGPIQRGAIDGMRPRVTHYEIQSFICTLGQRGLQAVIVRAVSVRHEVDEFEEWICPVEGSASLLAMVATQCRIFCNGFRVDLVDVVDAVLLVST